MFKDFKETVCFQTLKEEQQRMRIVKDLFYSDTVHSDDYQRFAEKSEDGFQDFARTGEYIEAGEYDSQDVDMIYRRSSTL